MGPWALAGAVSSVGAAGCLGQRAVVPDDADLSPIETPVILYDRTSPRPGSIVTLPRNAAGNSLQINVALIRGGDRSLEARWFKGRALVCAEDRFNCGELSIETPSDVTLDGGSTAEAMLTHKFSFQDQTACIAIDLYVASQFQQGDAVMHLPVRAGEVAHVRWYVVTIESTATSNVVDLSLCTK